MSGNVNPYVSPSRNRETHGEAPGPTYGLYPHISRYAVRDVPDSGDPENVDGAYATVLDADYESGTTPDAIRIGLAEPPENDPNDSAYNRQRYNEQNARYSVDKVTQDWHVQQSKVQRPIVPEWDQERAPIRSTATMAPMPYMFSTPKHRPRHIQDINPDSITHISMADHARPGEIMGMAPQSRLGANTYRLDPKPWDQDLFYPPQPTQSDVPRGDFGGARSYRL